MQETIGETVNSCFDLSNVCILTAIMAGPGQESLVFCHMDALLSQFNTHTRGVS